MKQEIRKPESSEEIHQDNTSGMKETANKTDRRKPKKGLPIKNAERKSPNS